MDNFISLAQSIMQSIKLSHNADPSNGLLRSCVSTLRTLEKPRAKLSSDLRYASIICIILNCNFMLLISYYEKMIQPSAIDSEPSTY